MKVYVVSLFDKYGEFFNVLGVFSSKKKKDEFIQAYKKSEEFDADWECFDVRERTINTPVEKLY